MENEHEGANDTNAGGIDVSQIDWSKVQLPEEVIKRTPAYQSVLSESIERRKALAELKAQQESPKGDTKADDKNSSDGVDIAAIVKEAIKPFSDELSALKQATAAEREQRVLAERQNIAKSAGLPETFASLLQGETVEAMTAHAQSLAEAVGIKSVPADQRSSATNPGQLSESEYTAQLDRVKSRMSAYEDDSLFKPGTHKSLGGGIVVNNKR